MFGVHLVNTQFYQELQILNQGKGKDVEGLVHMRYFEKGDFGEIKLL